MIQYGNGSFFSRTDTLHIGCCGGCAPAEQGAGQMRMAVDGTYSIGGVS